MTNDQDPMPMAPRCPPWIFGIGTWSFIGHWSLVIGHSPRTSPSRRCARSVSAFTLLELVISSALMSMILVSAYLCLSSSISSRKLIESRGEVAQSARVAMAMLSADLRCACPLSKEIAFLGMQRTLGDVEADNLDFATHNYTPRRVGQGDFCAVSYFLDKEPDSGKFSLWRRRYPAIPLDPLSGGSREEIARGLRGLKFEYYDGFDWYDDWGDPDGRKKDRDSLKFQPNLDGLPEAVRVTLWFELGPAPAKPVAAEEDSSAEPTMAFQTVCRLNLAGISLRKTSSAPANSGNSANQPAQAAPEGGNR
jgi:type II secretory pathway pseudopilin PulG